MKLDKRAAIFTIIFIYAAQQTHAETDLQKEACESQDDSEYQTINFYISNTTTNKDIGQNQAEIGDVSNQTEISLKSELKSEGKQTQSTTWKIIQKTASTTLNGFITLLGAGGMLAMMILTPSKKIARD